MPREGISLKMRKRVTTIFERTISLAAVASGILVVFVTIMICTDVLLRYFFDRPLKGVIELAGYGLLYITFLGTAWLLQREGHVKMDIVLNRLKPRNQALINAMTSILVAMCCLCVTWYGAQNAWEYFLTGFYEVTQLSLPVFHLSAIVALGFFLLFIQFLRRSYGYMERWRALPKKGQGL